jgi:hypothetical protein
MVEQGLKGALSPKNESLKSRYLGHRVRLEFVNPPQNANDSVPAFRVSLTAPVESDGAYSFVVDERVLADETAVVEVRSPLGTRLFNDFLRNLADGDRIRTITVDPEIPFEISSHPDPLKGRRATFIARVIDRDSKRDVSNRQVLIFAVLEGAADEDLEIAREPVFAGRTNEKGYVSGEHPAGIFAAALAEVDGVRTAVKLEADGTFPLRAVLVVPLPPESPTPSGSSSPPRTPDEEELLNAPELFSNDLGVGSCVDFTVPNRTLEEVPFYKIVRTTDPDIKGTNLEAPIKLQPDFGRLIKQLAFGENTLDSKLKVRSAPEVDLGLNVADPLINTDVIAAPRVETRFEASRDATTAAAISKKPPLDALATNGIFATAEWRDAIAPPSIDVALKEALPTLSAESLLSVLVDPDDFTPVSLMTAERLSTHQLLTELTRVSRKPAAGRAPLDETNPVDWDDTPTFYQATNIAHGHILQFRQVWKADGYSLGDLLHSIPLAPCQKKQIVTIDWDRREDAVRTEDLTEREFLFANLVRDRDVKEMMDTALSEEIDGGSTAKTYGGGGGLGFAIGPLVIGAGGGGSGADSEAWQDSSREISAQTMHELKDRISQSAAAVRSQRATVVQTLGQGERSRVETEVIANHNHCHALTIQYFEVLRHFQVSEELAEVRECLFVPFLMSHFQNHKVLRWRDALTQNLLKRSLLPAFDAVERIQLNYLGSDLPLGMFAEEPLESLDGELNISITIARPRDPKTDEVDYFEKVWPFWTRLIGGNPADVYDRFLQNQQFKDRIFREQLAPQIAEKFIASLRVVLLTDDGAEVEANLDPTLASKYRVGQTHTVTLLDSGNTPAVPRKNIVAIELRTDHELPEHSQVIVEGATFLYTTRHLRHPLYQNNRVLDDLLLGDPVFLSTSRLTKEEERNPRAEDQELRRRLLTHLNANIEYYHKAMWWTLDKERRFILLDGFIAPHSGGRSVASVVHNDLIGIVGNSLVFPVVAGFQLDPRYRALLEEDDDDNPETPPKTPPSLLDLYAPITPDPPRVLSVPTKGVFAEAVIGACNSCEKIDESRFWRWSQSPCPDDPPPIAPVDVTSRAGATPNLTATDFPAPIVNFQNIPEAPDPTGLGAVLQLIGQGNIFRDITGLTENQKNALATLQSSLSTAQAFGQEAVQLAHAQAAEKSIDQTLNSVLEAKKDGRLTDEAARTVMKGALQNFLGQQGTQATSVVDSESVQEAVGAAVDAGKSKVTVTEEKAGEQQTVEVSKEEATPGSEGQPATNVPTLAGPTTLRRTTRANYQVNNVPAGATFANWRFTSGTFVFNRPTDNDKSNWEGQMVLSGTVAVDMTVGTKTTTLSRNVIVTARPFTENVPTIPLGRIGNGALAEQPRVLSDLGITLSNGQLNIGFRLVDSGPNEGFNFLAREPVTWFVEAFSNDALYTASHPFFRAHNRTGTPAGRVRIADLRKEVEAHEGIINLFPGVPAGYSSHWQKAIDHLAIAANRINIPRESDVTHTSKESEANYRSRIIAVVEAGVQAAAAVTAPEPPRLFGAIYFAYPFIKPRTLALKVGDPASTLNLFNPAGGPTWTATPAGIVTVAPTATGATVRAVAAGAATIRVRNVDGEIDEIPVTVTT